MSIVTFVTGGQRSGKSRYAQEIAEAQSTHPLFLATSNEDEADFNARVARHKKDRGAHWSLIEEPIYLNNLHLEKYEVVLLDCVTLWLSNIFSDCDFDLDESFNKAKNIWQEMENPKDNLIVVSNEIGMGLHPHDAVSRKFVDLQGWVNQYIATRADKAVLMASGLPLVLKDTKS